MNKGVLLLVLRLAIAIFGVVQLYGMFNYVAMGIDADQWPETQLKNKTAFATIIGFFILIGSALTAIGLFNRIGPLLLAAGFILLALHFTFPALLTYTIFILFTGVLLFTGNGRYSTDRAIRGGK